MDFKSYFHNQYQGGESFIEEVIIPIFGEDKYEDAYDEDMLESNPELETMAASTGISQIIRLGRIDIPLNPTDVFDITVKDHVQMERNRVAIQLLVRRIMSTYSSAFMVFHYDDTTKWDWRFTFCSKQGKNSDTTDSKRYTFLLGPNQSCRTAAENFTALYKKSGNIELDDIIRAFDVEALSKEFFEKYKQHYEKFCNYIYDNKYDHTKFGIEFSQWGEKSIRDYVKKLLGRIVFLHFLQKKGWMGVPLDKDWGEGDQQFMKSLFDSATNAQKDNYLDEILEPLFTEALDTDRTETDDLYDTRVEGFRNVKVPYLNGGLFERDVLDEPKSVFPSNYFDDLFNFFYQYNFTIDENDPNDAQVGVDPEMLGRIFENLLEDNKDKGAFYTPKEIVQYMCRESLIAYLQTRCSTERAINAARHFVENHDTEMISKLYVQGADGKDTGDSILKFFDDMLLDVKICDPAIGSGAFPMGLLKEIFYCRMAIEKFTDAAEIKKHIIQQNIYGVDIEKGAVDIARLRFWLSLIVDEKTPHALPNMDFKIMQGNSLLEQYKNVDLSDIYNPKKLQYEIAFDDETTAKMLFRENIYKYFRVNNHQERKELLVKINNAVKSLVKAKTLNNPKVAKDVDSLDFKNNQEFFLWHTWFNDVFENGGFDIVIGNPPYVVTNQSDYPQYEWNSDLYKMFFEKSIKTLMKYDSIIAFITPKFYLLNKDDHELRKYFLNKIDLISLSLCNPFETAVTENVITIAQNQKARSMIVNASVYDNASGNFISLPNLDKEYCKDNKYCEMVLGIDTNTINVLKTIKKKGIPFGSIMVSKRGAEISKKNLRETIAGIPSLIGQDMKRYAIIWDNTYMDKSHKEYKRLSAFFNKEMIFLRRVAPRLEATFSNGVQYGFNKNVYGIKIIDSNKWNEKYVVALLNSKVLDFYYKKRFTLKKEDAFPEIQSYLYEQLPIAKVSNKQCDKIVSIVETILEIKKVDSQADTSSLEAEIDRLVYDLYGLTEEEIAIIEGTN